jgi:hypothetical protein
MEVETGPYASQLIGLEWYNPFTITYLLAPDELADTMK